MKITVNGKPFVIDSGISLKQLLQDRGLDPAKTVVAVNGNIAGNEIILKENDVLDVMSFVGGG